MPPANCSFDVFTLIGGFGSANSRAELAVFKTGDEWETVFAARASLSHPRQCGGILEIVRRLRRSGRDVDAAMHALVEIAEWLSAESAWTG